LIVDFKNSFGFIRDDLFPFLGGGNKGRKIVSIAKDIIEKGCNAVVTTGGIQSNHCRATAILAAQMGWSCTLVIHGTEQDFFKGKGNSLIMSMAGAKCVFVEPDEISSAMDAAMNELEQQGLMPYYIQGGGHTLEGGLAYIEAIKELQAECIKLNWIPDYIFLASGTGSTQGGILAGLDNSEMESNVVGISVGRARIRAEQVVKAFYADLCENYRISCSNREVLVLDEYLCGGYGQYNDEIWQLSQNSLRTLGFTLDTTYTAKAYYGMLDYVKKNDIKGNILFWHTGGLLNFLAEN
jgi:D-cysteine desulfhydrase